MAHDHAGHGHAPEPADLAAAPSHRRRLLVVVVLTSVVLLAQIIGSAITGSLALLTDTVHAATDVGGLVVALTAATLMLRPADPRRTWGFRRVEIIAALGQATLLLGVGLFAAIEGVRRLFEPPEVPATELLIFGVIGLMANVASMLILYSGRSANFNMKAAFLEVVNDALGSLGVIVAAIVISTTGFQQADALAALFIAALIVPRAVVIMRGTARVLMEFTPDRLDLDEVRSHLLDVEHVREVHDLHASTVATGLPVLTAHLVVGEKCFQNGHALEILDAVRDCVETHFKIAHTTFQLETTAFRGGEHAGHD